MKIGEYLLSDGKITEDQLQDALLVQSISDMNIGEILIEKGYATDLDVAKALANQSGHGFLEEINELDISVNEKLSAGFLYEIPAVAIKRFSGNYIVCSGISSSLSEKLALDGMLKDYKIVISTKNKIYEALNKIFISAGAISEKDILKRQ